MNQMIEYLSECQEQSESIDSHTRDGSARAPLCAIVAAGVSLHVYELPRALAWRVQSRMPCIRVG